MKKIKFYNVDRFYQDNKDKILELTDEVFSGGKVLEGNYVVKCEEELAKITDRKFAITVNSCTDALFFALSAAGIKKGDEVLVPAFSFISSASAIVRTGATPVFVDVNEDGLIDIDKASEKITNKTKAIIAVHNFGRMVNTEELICFSGKYNLIAIEDAAQSLGSSYNQIPAGKSGITGCFSFDPSKIIHAFGTGGVVVTDDPEIADKVKKVRIHGKSRQTEEIETAGYNSRIPSLQAAVLYLQLLKISEITEKRNSVARYYNSVLVNIPGLRLIQPSPAESWNYHKFPVFTSCRDELRSFLTSNNIETGIHYPKILPCYSIFGQTNKNFPVAQLLSETELSIPVYPELTGEEMKRICDCIVKFYNSKNLC